MGKCVDILVDNGYTRADAIQVCVDMLRNLGYVNLVLFVESVQRRSSHVDSV